MFTDVSRETFGNGGGDKIKKNTHLVFSHIENIIYYMGQSCLTALSVISDSIDMGSVSSLNLVANLEKDLDNNQYNVDELCYEIIKNHDLLDDELKLLWIYMRNGDYLERIGDLSMNTVSHLKKVFGCIDENINIADINDYFNKIKDIVVLSIESFINKEVSRSYDVFDKRNKLNQYKEKIIEKLIGLMELNAGYTPICMELIFSIVNLDRITKLSINIAETTLYVVENKDLRLR